MTATPKRERGYFDLRGLWIIAILVVGAGIGSWELLCFVWRHVSVTIGWAP
jgi:hypothetical protein